MKTEVSPNLLERTVRAVLFPCFIGFLGCGTIGLVIAIAMSMFNPEGPKLLGVDATMGNILMFALPFAMVGFCGGGVVGVVWAIAIVVRRLTGRDKQQPLR